MMDNQTVVTAVLIDEHTTISIVDVCQRCGISEDVLLEMIEHGLFSQQVAYSKNMYFDEKKIGRIQAASRIQHDLDVNVPGVVLVLELLDELEQLRNQLHILQHHASLP